MPVHPYAFFVNIPTPGLLMGKSDLGRTTTLLKDRLGRVPTTEELARATGLTLEAVRSLGALNTEAVRLDHPTRDGDNSERMERFASLDREGTDGPAIANSQTSDIEAALATLRKGGEYKDGAIFVDAVNTVEEKNGIYVPGPKAKTLVMIRDRKAESTGGWVFQAFDPAGKPLKIDPVKNCFECHQSGAKDSGFVFHKYAE